MIWAAKGYDQEALDALCRQAPDLCEQPMWCNPNCVWVQFGVIVAVCVLLLLLLAYLVKRRI